MGRILSNYKNWNEKSKDTGKKTNSITSVRGEEGRSTVQGVCWRWEGASKLVQRKVRRKTERKEEKNTGS